MRKRNILIASTAGTILLLLLGFIVRQPSSLTVVGISLADARMATRELRHSALKPIPGLLRKGAFGEAWRQAKLFTTLRVKGVSTNLDQTINVDFTTKLTGAGGGTIVMTNNGRVWVIAGIREARPCAGIREARP